MKKFVIYLSLILSIILMVIVINKDNNIETTGNSESGPDYKANDLVFREDWIYLDTNNHISINSFTLDVLSGTIYIINKNEESYDVAASFSLPINDNMEYPIDESGYYKAILVEDNNNEAVTDITPMVGIGHSDIIK